MRLKGSQFLSMIDIGTQRYLLNHSDPELQPLGCPKIPEELKVLAYLFRASLCTYFQGCL